MNENTRGGSSDAIGVERQEENDPSTNTTENSPESAGLARGLARTAASRGAPKVAIGRLPLGKSAIKTSGAVRSTARTTSTTAARNVRMARGRMARIRKVAKVSDRAATGLDVGEAALQEASPSNQQSWKIRAGNFVGSLAKNTLVGAAVFWTYEEAIDGFQDLAWKENQRGTPEYSATNYEEEEEEDTGGGALVPLSQHFAAGFGAGCVHAGLGRLLDAIVAPIQHRFGWGETAVSPSIARAGPALLPHMLHHATSHAVLFGSYETIKRSVALALANTTSQDPHMELETTTSDIVEEHENTKDWMDYLDGQLFAVAFAGGTAGILQQVASDVTEQLQKAKGTGTTSWRMMAASIQPPRYSARSLLMLSFPTSIGFIAFEYGREAMTES